MAEYSLEDLGRIVRALRGSNAPSPSESNAVSAPVPPPAINHPKSTAVVSDRLDLTLPEARRFIYDILLHLTDGDFCHTSPSPRPPADIYAIVTRGVGWYIKFKIHPSDRLELCAFHPPEAPIRTIRGDTISWRG